MDTSPLRFNPNALRQARGERRVEEIASVAGKSAQTIRNWEAGVYPPDAESLARIARHLQLDLDAFFVAGAA